jgi:transcriptional regulator with XRE-family HTH domain
MSYFKKMNEFFKKTGLTQTEIGEKIGYSQIMVGRYLSKNKPNYEFIKAVSKEFDVDWNYIFKEDSSELRILEEEIKVYKKSPEDLLNELQKNLNELKDWHNLDAKNK